ncbi:MAG: creatininase family protein, partial [Anaerolineales bacterium]|nr:creatininase family protein [Anaerolineales bacterium]
AHDDRAVLPLGSTEQHAYLSLSVDSILAERMAVEAAKPLGVPVFPALAYGITPYFLAYPGTVSLRVETYLSVVRDVLDSLVGHGFRRILIVNGHGGNVPANAMVGEWLGSHPTVRVKWHDWWRAPQTWTAVQHTDPLASHASWMENFPWTRLPGIAMPETQKRLPDRSGQPALSPQAARAFYGDGNFNGRYQRPDEEMIAIWETAVAETRTLLQTNWD